MTGRAGGKQKPLKAAKKVEKDLDDDDKVIDNHIGELCCNYDDFRHSMPSRGRSRRS